MSEPTSFDFDVFLSHASEDKDDVRAFVRSLQNASLKVWFDEEQLPPGFDPKGAIPPALEASRHVLIWVTEPWLRKSWTQWELKLFAEALKSRDRRVIPVLRIPWDNEVLGPYLTPQLAIPRDLDGHERLWLAVCGVRGTGPGPRDTWTQCGRELRPHSRDSVPVRQQPLDQLEPDLRQYLASAVAFHREISLAGFETRVRVPIRLEDLYVPLNAMLDEDPCQGDPFDNAEHALEQLEGRGAHREIMLSEAFRVADRQGWRGIVILGDPGSGKTTHLKRILLKISNDGAESLGLPESSVPVFLPLRNLLDTNQGLDAFIQAELSRPHLRTPPDFGTRLRDRGRIVYLLDGLDEVRDPKDRAQVSKWIDEALRSTPDCVFVVTCRYAGYRETVRLDGKFLELHLRPLTDDQVKVFVERWFDIVETSLVAGERRSQAERRAQERSGELLAELARPEFQAAARVYALTHNPLLLTTICLVHRDRGRLPDKRVELYDECVNVLLELWNEAKERRNRAKRIEAKIPANKARRVLQPVARWLHEEEGRRQASEQELAPVLSEALEPTGLEVEPGAFLRSIRDESGLLTGWGPDRYGFMHLGFQEFLAAREIRNRELLEPGPFWELAQRFDDSWWQEVILLMLAHDDPPLFERFMREVVGRPEFPRWAESEMMGLCLAEAAEPVAGPFVKVLGEPVAPGREDRLLAAARVLVRIPGAEDKHAKLLQEHPNEDVQAWWLARQDKALRRGRNTLRRHGVELVLIPGGRFTMGEGAEAHAVELDEFYLARTPVTNAQYRRYLEENPEAPKPEYWGDRRFNQDEQPVVGVSWKEARAYCEWARLELPTEAQWEYACRAGTTTRYYSGNTEEDLARVGWYDKNSDGRTQPVGQKEPNAFGLYDMHGNVWEWCHDARGPYTTSPREGDGLRHEPVGDANRVLRGGSWDGPADVARSAIRIAVRPGSRSYAVGFRPAQGHHQ